MGYGIVNNSLSNKPLNYAAAAGGGVNGEKTAVIDLGASKSVVAVIAGCNQQSNSHVSITVTVSYGVNGADESTLGTFSVSDQGSNTAVFTAPITARYIKIKANSTWTGITIAAAYE